MNVEYGKRYENCSENNSELFLLKIGDYCSEYGYVKKITAGGIHFDSAPLGRLSGNTTFVLFPKKEKINLSTKNAVYKTLNIGL